MEAVQLPLNCGRWYPIPGSLRTKIIEKIGVVRAAIKGPVTVNVEGHARRNVVPSNMGYIAKLMKKGEPAVDLAHQPQVVVLEREVLSRVLFGEIVEKFLKDWYKATFGQGSDFVDEPPMQRHKRHGYDFRPDAFATHNVEGQNQPVCLEFKTSERCLSHIWTEGEDVEFSQEAKQKILIDYGLYEESFEAVNTDDSRLSQLALYLEALGIGRGALIILFPEGLYVETFPASELKKLGFEERFLELRKKVAITPTQAVLDNFAQSAALKTWRSSVIIPQDPK